MDRKLEGEKDHVTLNTIAREQIPYLRAIDPIHDWSGYESLSSDQAYALFAQFCVKSHREGLAALPTSIHYFFGMHGEPPCAEICTVTNEWFLVSKKEIVPFIRERKQQWS